MVPALFDGIQFGGVWRQPLESEPIGMATLEIRRSRTVRAKTIPNDGHVSTIVATQAIEQPDELVRVDVCLHHVEVER